MEKRILVPITPSEISREIIRRADRWGERTGAELRFLHVRAHVNPLDVDFLPEDESIEHNYKELDQFIKDQDLKSRYSISIRVGVVYTQIIEEERSFKPDLIIMAAHSHTAITRFFLGSNTDYTIHHSRCPVYVFKTDNESKNNVIIIPLDYSGVNSPVVRLADEWAQRAHSKLHFIHVAIPPANVNVSGKYVWTKAETMTGQERRQNERVKNLTLEQNNKLENYLKSFDLKSDYEYSVEFGKPYLKVLELQTKLNAILIMMATHSHTLIGRIFIGSTTDYLLHHTSCSMFVYKE